MKELTVEATIKNIEAVTDFINDELETLGCPLKTKIQIDVAIDELFGNIARYAYGGETGKAEVRIEFEDDSVIITFIDSGKPFNPTERAEPDTTLPVEERAVGGLGIFLVKKTMDMMDYKYSGGKNILKIKKTLR